MGHVAIGNLGQQVADAVQAGAFFVHRFHQPPRGFGNVGVFQHGFLGLGIIFPAAAGFQVHGAKFPLFDRVVNPHLEAQMLFVVGDREPVFDQDDSRPHQHFFKFRHVVEKFFHIFFATEAHHPFDTGAVVP